MRLVAVTGTNGKSTVVAFTRQLLEHAGLDAWSLGNFGLVGPGYRDPEPFFVRGPGGLRRFLERAVPARPDAVVVAEAYSVALAAGDWDGLRVEAAAFTSLGRDHLDVHGSEAAYRAAKLRLLGRYLRPGGAALVHRTVAAALGPELDRLVVGIDVRTYGHADTTRFIEDNVACARGLAAAMGVREPGTAPLRPPPGRMQEIGCEAGFQVVVDFAHDPGALAAALGALRSRARAPGGCLTVVFGCGGDRDRGKRPEMGAVAARLAERVYVTDDHPRSEEPAAIRRQILTGCPGAVEVAGRRAAITRALREARRLDVVLLAGMGHERWGGGGPDTRMTDSAAAEQILGEPAGGTGGAADADARDRRLGAVGAGTGPG